MGPRTLRTFIAAMAMVGTLIAGVPPVVAQSSTTSIFQNAAEKAKELDDVLRALQTANGTTQYALVEILLAEEDPAMRRIGREFALFSTNPVLRNMAIVSAFNTNTQVRLQLTGGDKPEVYGWAEDMGGASSGDSASVMLGTWKYNGNCWADRYDNCRWYIQGERVQFRDKANSRFAQADLALGADGVLRGPIVMNTGRAQVAIDLK